MMSLLVNKAYSQPAREWIARSNSDFEDELSDMAVDDLGNVYVTGASMQGVFTTDFITTKYDRYGTPQWYRLYNGVEDSQDKAYAITVDYFGNIYVTGSTNYDNGIVTIKYNSIGDTLWTRRYTGPGTGNNWTYPTSIAVDDSGYVYVAGTSEGLTGMHDLFQDYTTLKYSPEGEQIWEARYNGLGNDDDVIESMVVDPYGNVYVTGYTNGGSLGNDYSFEDITTIKYTTDGEIDWVQNYVGPGTSGDKANMIALDDYGNVYITGKTFTRISNEDIILIKYDSEGTELWQRIYNGPESGTDEGVALTIDNLYNVYIIGKSDYGKTNGFDIVTNKYRADGTNLWTKNFNGTANSNDFAIDVALDKAGNIYVLGTVININSNNDYQLLKYSPTGILLWQTTYNDTDFLYAPLPESAASLFVDADNNVYIAGTEALGYSVVKYSQFKEDAELAEGNFIPVYPNPSTGLINIWIANSDVEVITVYNLVGEVIYSRSNLKKRPFIEIDLTAIPRGIYFIHHLGANGEKIHVEKIVIH